MIKNDFEIFKSLISGYKFLADNLLYTLKISLIPLFLHITCNMFLQLQRPDASIFESYLWQLPSVAAFGWMLFLQIRLMFFLEKLDTPITHPIFIAERKQAKQASVIIFILFNMFFKFSSIGLLMVSSSSFLQSHGSLGFMPLLMLIFILWSVKFGLLYIVAAVSFPLGLFVKAIKSPFFSIQLLALAFVAALPVMIIFQILLPMLVPELFNGEGFSTISEANRIRVVLITAPITLFSSLVVNACLASAVKQMLFFKNRL